MRKLIKQGEILEDRWTLLKQSEGAEVLQAVPGRNLIVPLQFWKEFQQELSEYNGEIGIWIDSHELLADLGDSLESIPLIALNFPAFADGRSYSKARELRQGKNYQGEIRAIGDVLRDQLFYMSRCGFDTFSLRHDQDPELCLAAFDDFSTNYQATVTEPSPLFRRR